MSHAQNVVYGRHTVRAVFLTRPQDITRIVILEGKNRKWTDEYLQMAAVSHVDPELLPWRDFIETTGLREEDRHQGICVFTKPRQQYDEYDLTHLATGHLVVALDQISNPQNLGTILRTSGFFGVDALLILRNQAAEITPEVLRVASGGAEFVKVHQVTNLRRSLKALKDLGYWIYGLDERGECIAGETDYDTKCVLVVGAEGGGLRRMTKESCDFLVRIPGGREGIESINAAVAASIAIADFNRWLRVSGSRPNS